MCSVFWYCIDRLPATMQAADDCEIELRRSLRDTELKHKQHIKHKDASVQELQRYDHLAMVQSSIQAYIGVDHASFAAISLLATLARVVMLQPCMCTCYAHHGQGPARMGSLFQDERRTPCSATFLKVMHCLQPQQAQFCFVGCTCI